MRYAAVVLPWHVPGSPPPRGHAPDPVGFLGWEVVLVEGGKEPPSHGEPREVLAQFPNGEGWHAFNGWAPPEVHAWVRRWEAELAAGGARRERALRGMGR